MGEIPLLVLLGVGVGEGISTVSNEEPTFDLEGSTSFLQQENGLGPTNR